jgi:hypothetical protein
MFALIQRCLATGKNNRGNDDENGTSQVRGHAVKTSFSSKTYLRQASVIIH